MWFRLVFVPVFFFFFFIIIGKNFVWDCQLMSKTVWKKNKNTNMYGKPKVNKAQMPISKSDWEKQTTITKTKQNKTKKNKDKNWNESKQTKQSTTIIPIVSNETKTKRVTHNQWKCMGVFLLHSLFYTIMERFFLSWLKN